MKRPNPRGPRSSGRSLAIESLPFREYDAVTPLRAALGPNGPISRGENKLLVVVGPSCACCVNAGRTNSVLPFVDDDIVTAAVRELLVEGAGSVESMIVDLGSIRL